MPKYPTYPDCFDECKQVTITNLKRLGFLVPNTTLRGTIRWTRGGEPSGSIGICVSLLEKFVELDYKCDGKLINYRVRLQSIPKHFGGCEWYFICPVTARRCRSLYLIGGYFFSRAAYPSAMYSSQTESKHTRGMLRAFRCLDLQSDFLSRRHTRTTYRGKLTKRYRRILEKEGRFDPQVVQRFLSR